MNIVQVIQGSSEWHNFRTNHFTASDASAMLGLSQYKTRAQLLTEKKTGVYPEPNASQQALFDKGHKVESDARKILEETKGEDYFSVTGVSKEWDKMAASLDGQTFDESSIFEHKLWNKKLVSFIQDNKDLPETHWPQVEHQLYVSGSEKCIFVVSDGTRKNWVELEYTSKPERMKQVLDGWSQFESDLENYEAKPVVAECVANPVSVMPSILFELDRSSLTITSNISEYKAAAVELVEKSKEPLTDDQSFADAEERNKRFKKAESSLDLVIDSVYAQIVDVDDFIKEIREVKALLRQVRLNSEKQVKARKEEIKRELIMAANALLSEHATELEKNLSGFRLSTSADFSGAIKGKKTLRSMQDSIDQELANAKIKLNEMAKVVSGNLGYLEGVVSAEIISIVFPDLDRFLSNDAMAFAAIVDTRMREYEERQQEQAKESEEELKQAAQEGSSTIESSHIKEPKLPSIEALIADWITKHGISDQAYSELMDIISNSTEPKKRAA